MPDTKNKAERSNLMRNFALVACAGLMGVLVYDRYYGESELEGVRINYIADSASSDGQKLLITNSPYKVIASSEQAEGLSVGDCMNLNVRGMLAASSGSFTVALNSATKVAAEKCKPKP